MGLATTPRIAAAVDAHRQLVMETVLAVELEIVDAGEDLDPDWMRGWDHVATGDLDGEPITVGIRRT
jgi:hypothetical protein